MSLPTTVSELSSSVFVCAQANASAGESADESGEEEQQQQDEDEDMQTDHVEREQEQQEQQEQARQQQELEQAEVGARLTSTDGLEETNWLHIVWADGVAYAAEIDQIDEGDLHHIYVT